MTASPVIVAPNGRPARAEMKFRNFYEAIRPSPKRSYNWSWVNDADLDISRWARWELIRQARHLYQNSPFICGLVERLVTYTVGTGLHPVPASSDPEWNDRAREAWCGFARQPMVNNRWTFDQYQRVVARGKFVDGESFTLLTYGQSGRARLQGIEAHRVGGTYLGASATDPDGIEFDKLGRPTSYRIRNINDPYPAEDIVHHFTPIRMNQHRGITILASAINTARDIDDILSLEKSAVKDASATKDIIKRGLDEITDEDALRQGEQTASTTGMYVNPQDASQYYQRVMGPEHKLLMRGDEYQPFQPNRPGPAWQGFMEFLTHTICLSANLPPSILLQIKVGGADTRRDLAAAQRTFELWQMDLACEFQRVYEYIIESEIEDGTLGGAPNDWRKVSWQYPKAITVDAGREAQQDRQDVQFGLLTRQEYWGRYGMDWQTEEEQIIAEAIYRKGLLEDAGMELDEFVKLSTLDPSLFKEQTGGGPAEPQLNR